MTEGDENSVLSMIQKHMSERLVFPTKNDVVGAAFSLMILVLTYRVHPTELVEGKLGYHQTSSRLTFEDVKYIANEILFG